MGHATRRLLVIRAAWSRYSACLPAHSPSVQVTETRRAFYGGAMAMLAAIAESLPPGEDSATASGLRPEAEGAALWDGLEARANRQGDFAEITAFPADPAASPKREDSRKPQSGFGEFAADLSGFGDEAGRA